MKKLFISLVAVLSFTSCKKSSPPNPTNASVGFIFQGSIYHFNNGYFNYTMQYQNGHLSGEGIDCYTPDSHTHFGFSFSDYYDSVAINTNYTFRNTNSSQVSVNNVFWTTDSLSFTMTRKSNGTIDAIFSGKISRYTTPTTNDVEFITDGSFKNIPIKYTF